MASNLVTVFGGSGFLGREIVKHLVAVDYHVRVAVRHPEAASFSGKTGPVGRVELVHADVSDESTVAEAVEGAGSVVNSVGHYVEKPGATFHRIHALGAQHIARHAGQAGVGRLVQISGLGADAASDSPYVRSRGVGDELVREAFEAVTILRPSVIFGPGDALLNKLADMARLSPVLPLFGDGRTRMQPVFVGDVAQACVRALADPSAAGGVYELGGPEVFAYRELVRLLLERTGRRRVVVPIPFGVWEILARGMAWHPNPPLTRDQVALLRSDNVVAEEALTLADLDVRPSRLEEVLLACIGPLDELGVEAGAGIDNRGA